MPTAEEREGTLCGAMRGNTAEHIASYLRTPRGYHRYEEIVLQRMAADLPPAVVLVSGCLWGAHQQVAWRTPDGTVFDIA